MDVEMSEFSCEVNNTSDYFQVRDDRDYSYAVSEEPAILHANRNESNTSTKITLTCSRLQTAIVEEPAYLQIVADDSEYLQIVDPDDTQVKTNDCSKWTSDHNEVKSTADDNNFCQAVDDASGYLQPVVCNELTESDYLQPVDIVDGYLQAVDMTSQYRASLGQPVIIADYQSLYDEVIENRNQIIDQICETKHQQIIRHESSVQHHLQSQSNYQAQQEDQDLYQQVEDQREQSGGHVVRCSMTSRIVLVEIIMAMFYFLATFYTILLKTKINKSFIL
jgi:hypothetical protein